MRARSPRPSRCPRPETPELSAPSEPPAHRARVVKSEDPSLVVSALQALRQDRDPARRPPAGRLFADLPARRSGRRGGGPLVRSGRRAPQLIGDDVRPALSARTRTAASAPPPSGSSRGPRSKPSAPCSPPRAPPVPVRSRACSPASAGAGVRRARRLPFCALLGACGGGQTRGRTADAGAGRPDLRPPADPRRQRRRLRALLRRHQGLRHRGRHRIPDRARPADAGDVDRQRADARDAGFSGPAHRLLQRPSDRHPRRRARGLACLRRPGAGPAPTTPAAGSWYHVAYSYDTTTHLLYVNGALADTETVRPTSGRRPRSGWEALDGSTNLFKGHLDEVRVWTITRTASEIASDMAHGRPGPETGLVAYWTFDDAINGGRAIDFSGSGNDVTLGDGVAAMMPTRVASTAPLGTSATTSARPGCRLALVLARRLLGRLLVRLGLGRAFGASDGGPACGGRA